jgi:hypothetical protein
MTLVIRDFATDFAGFRRSRRPLAPRLHCLDRVARTSGLTSDRKTERKGKDISVDCHRFSRPGCHAAKQSSTQRPPICNLRYHSTQANVTSKAKGIAETWKSYAGSHKCVHIVRLDSPIPSLAAMERKKTLINSIFCAIFIGSPQVGCRLTA